MEWWGMFETIIKMFCEDAQHPNVDIHNVVNCSGNPIGPLIDLIDQFLISLGNGWVIT